MCPFAADCRDSVGLAATEYRRIIGLPTEILCDGAVNSEFGWPITIAGDVPDWTLCITGVDWFGVWSRRLWPPLTAWPFVRAKWDGAAVSFGIGRDCTTAFGVDIDEVDECDETRMRFCFGWSDGGRGLIALLTFAGGMMNVGFGRNVGIRPCGVDIRLVITQAGCCCDRSCIDAPVFDMGLWAAANIWFLTDGGKDLRIGCGGGISVDSWVVSGLGKCVVVTVLVGFVVVTGLVKFVAVAWCEGFAMACCVKFGAVLICIGYFAFAGCAPFFGLPNLGYSPLARPSCCLLENDKNLKKK